MADRNNIRIGRVSSVDYTNGMIRVTFPDRDGAVSSLLPVLSLNGEYKMPQVGENVLVAMLSNGTGAGIALGSYWNLSNKPPVSGAGHYRKDFGKSPGTAYMDYDAASGTLTIHARKVVINGDSEVDVIAPTLYNSNYWAKDRES